MTGRAAKGAAGVSFLQRKVATDDDDCYEDDGICGGGDIAFCNHDLSHFFKQSRNGGNGGDNKD